MRTIHSIYGCVGGKVSIVGGLWPLKQARQTFFGLIDRYFFRSIDRY